MTVLTHLIQPTLPFLFLIHFISPLPFYSFSLPFDLSSPSLSLLPFPPVFLTLSILFLSCLPLSLRSFFLSLSPFPLTILSPSPFPSSLLTLFYFPLCHCIFLSNSFLFLSLTFSSFPSTHLSIRFLLTVSSTHILSPFLSLRSISLLFFPLSLLLIFSHRLFCPSHQSLPLPCPDLPPPLSLPVCLPFLSPKVLLPLPSPPPPPYTSC